jgi:hypothetical protein
MAKRSRLLTTVFRPDVWFVMPPACNVVFPEECVSVNYNRQMMRETTRLQLQTFSGILTDSNSAGAAAQLIEQYYFAPSLVETAQQDGVLLPSLPDKLGKGPTSAASLSALMYEYEKFTGIIPKIERIPDTAFYAAGEAITPGATRDPRTTATIEQYAQRVALFNFLRNRYMARQASVTGRFMPRIVAGFPALVVNRPKITSTDDPIHFVGLVTSLSHSLTQDGGNTSIGLSYARPHTIAKEEDSFLRLLKALSEEVVFDEPDKDLTIDDPAGAAELREFGKRWALGAAGAVSIDEDPVELFEAIVRGDIDRASLLYSKYTKTQTTIIPTDEAIDPASFACEIMFYNRTNPDLSDPSAEEYWGSVGPKTIWNYFESLPTDQEKDRFLSLYGLAGVVTINAQGRVLSMAEITLADFEAWFSQNGIEFLNGGGAVYPVVTSLRYTISPVTFKRSFEQIVTPAWFSTQYSNSKISGYYESLLGCPALSQRVGASESDTRLTTQGINEQNDFSVEAATVKIVEEYSASGTVKSNDGDPQFVFNYTRREIPRKDEVLHFHRLAFTGSPTALYGLDPSAGVTEESSFVAKNKTDNSEALDLTETPYLDPRQERRAAVNSYVSQLSLRAFRG